ncbi:MAG: hypothetical protein J6U54_24260 [Clostridiales bacterium]|nr:hypothetical protein [Clostridiales bacterium]
MNEMLIRQFSLDIEKNTREIARLNRQVKRLRRKAFFAGTLALVAVGGIIFLDKHMEKELAKQNERLTFDESDE